MKENQHKNQLIQNVIPPKPSRSAENDIEIKDEYKDLELAAENKRREKQREKLRQQLHTKRRVSAEADIKYLDFFTNFQGKIIRTSLAIMSSFVIFIVWIYRDINVARNVDGSTYQPSATKYDGLNNIEVISWIIIVFFVINIVCLTLSNLLLMMRHKRSKREDLINHEILINEHHDNTKNENYRQRLVDANRLVKRNKNSKKAEKALSIAGWPSFVIGCIATIILIMVVVANVDNKINENSDSQTKSEDSQQN